MESDKIQIASGAELRNTSREIVGLIIQAHAARDKPPELLRPPAVCAFSGKRIL
jgi:hypothetical protein